MNKKQAKKLFETLNLKDEWKYSTDGYGYDINHKYLPQRLQFKARNDFGVTLVGIDLYVFFPYISYIINKIIPDFDSSTSFVIRKDFDIILDNEDDYFEFALPIWKNQWEKLEPLTTKYDNPQKLYQAELESLKNDKEPLWYGSSFFIISYNIKSLILSRLISDEAYIKRKEIYLEFEEVYPPQSEQSIKLRDVTNKLITYLDSLNADEYLTQQPWKSTVVAKESSNPIELNRTSMLTINNPLTVDDISILFGTNSNIKVDTFTAAESAIMLLSDKEELHILQLKPTVIAFIQNPIVYESLNLEMTTGEALKFVIDEGASDSIRIDYYKNGAQCLSYMYSMGEEIENIKHKNVDLNKDDPRITIDKLFARVAGRRLDEIMEDEEGLVYQFKITTT